MGPRFGRKEIASFLAKTKLPWSSGWNHMCRCKGGAGPQFQGTLPSPESRDPGELCSWASVGEGAASNSVISEAFVTEAFVVACLIDWHQGSASVSFCSYPVGHREGSEVRDRLQASWRASQPHTGPPMA